MESDISGPGAGGDGIDTRDTDRIDYPAEFVHKFRLELRAVVTALGAVENTLSGPISPQQRRSIFFGLAETFGRLMNDFGDSQEMMLNFVAQCSFELGRK